MSPTKRSPTTFAELDLIEPLLRAVAEMKYEEPTPIQLQTIPPLLEGRDLLGCAQTGTGKTAAFALPVLQMMEEEGPWEGKRTIRTLVLAPTRELAAQIEESMSQYAKHLDVQLLVIFGGVNEKPQIAALREGVDVLVATPGRLMDLYGRGFMNFDDVEFFVLDEADRMLDMGFIRDIRKIIATLPPDRQNLLFSATMPEPIVKLASSFLDNPVTVEVAPPQATVDLIRQEMMFVSKADKRQLLAELLVKPEMARAIVFTRTKHGANRLCKQLDKDGIRAAAIHGNKSQAARNRAMDGFRDGDIPVLVATDIASRGIDVEGVTHVFNYDLPNEPESYIHRIGRTGRAGRDGIAISFCDEGEGEYLTSIEKLTGLSIPVVVDHPYHCEGARPSRSRSSAPRPPVSRGRERADGSETPSARSRRRGPRRRAPGQAAGEPSPVQQTRRAPRADSGGKPVQTKASSPPAASPSGNPSRGRGPRQRP
jgi:ATP-dependent RNA helicase RhlE